MNTRWKLMQSITTLLYELVFISLSTCNKSHYHNQPMETKKTHSSQSATSKQKAVLTCSHWVRYCHSDKSHYDSPFLLTCRGGRNRAVSRLEAKHGHDTWGMKIISLLKLLFKPRWSEGNITAQCLQEQTAAGRMENLFLHMLSWLSSELMKRWTPTLCAALWNLCLKHLQYILYTWTQLFALKCYLVHWFNRLGTDSLLTLVTNTVTLRLLSKTKYTGGWIWSAWDNFSHLSASTVKLRPVH